jgi:Zn-dependent protease
MTLFAFESFEEPRRRKLFTLLEVDYFSTHRFWVNIPLTAVAGIAVALIFSPADQLVSQVLVGLGFGLLIIVSSFIHGLGHIISSRMVKAPMKSLIMTATVNVTHFEDMGEQSSRVHVGRSLGGPVLNLILGVLAIAIYLIALDSYFLLFFGIVNLGFGGFTILPIPSLDGSVILRELRDWK